MRFLDILGVAVIFIVTAYVGYFSTKKVKSFNDFTLAGNKLSKLEAGLSMAATEFGGSSLIGAMAFGYTVGIAGAWWDWSAVPAFILLGIFFAGKMKLPGMVTITDFLEKRYSRSTKVVASVMHLLAIITQLSTQFLVGAVALHGVLGVPQNVGLIATVLFVLLYTMGGGMIAVVNTDIVQFVMIMATLAIALPISLVKVGGYSGLVASLPPEFLSFGNIELKTVLSWSLFCIFTYATNQHYIQRIFAAKDKATARFAFIFTGASYFVYGLAIAIIGICIVVLLPGLEDPNVGYAMFIRNYIPVGIAGLVLGGIFAASMSTASSMLLAASVLFINDIYGPIMHKNKAASDKQSLRAIRIITVLVCVFSITISFFLDNIIRIMYLGGLFYSTAVFFPLVVGLIWKRATAAAAFCSILASVAAGLIAEFFLSGKAAGILGLPSNILAASVSIIVLVAVSLLTKKPAAQQVDFLRQAEGE